ncbi:MAG: GMC family oxidoreductase [Brachymonas sp.]
MVILPQEADFVVIGAGSAGCIVASRLAENGHSVLLLEAGEAAEAHPETLRADGFKDAFANDATMWQRMSAKMPGMGRKYLGTGRGMGGSGSVNGMVYTRGDARDYANWGAGWQWADCLPAFEAVEARLQPRPRFATLFVERFIKACVGAGMQAENGLNSGDLSAKVGANDMNYAGDKRRSSYRAFIKEPLADKGSPLRQHLRIVLGAQVEGIVFEGQSAKSVRYTHQGQTHEVQVGKEVILTAGALETPRLLLLSGVGEAAHLRSLGLPVVLDSAGVGQNLQDHPNVCLFYRSKTAPDFAFPQVYAFDTATGEAGAPQMCWVGFAAHATLRHAMHRMLPILALPEFLLRQKWLRWALRRCIDGAMFLRPVDAFVEKLFGIVVILGKPTSRGSVRLASKNPQDAALIDPAWYQSPHDQQLMEQGIERAQQIAAQPSLVEAGLKPLSAGAKPGISQAKLWKWLRKASMTTYHFAGSCRMGADAASPVSPADLRVKGLANVRVMDASLMPEIPVAALNAPSMMLAWRGADMVLAEYGVRDFPLPEGEGQG